MEDRTLLSTLTVTSNSDSGNGSLRAAIAAAASGETINFSPTLKGEAITLASGPLTLGVNQTIDGLGANKLTISGGGTEGVLVVSAGVTATVENLTIASGLAAPGSWHRQPRHADGQPMHALRQHGHRGQRRLDHSRRRQRRRNRQ